MPPKHTITLRRHNSLYTQPTQCQTTNDPATPIAIVTPGANLEVGVRATTSGATQATRAATAHEVHDKTAAGDETMAATARARQFDETSATVTEAAATEDEATATIVGAAIAATEDEVIATTVGPATAVLRQALALALSRAVHPPAPREQRPKSSSPTRSTTRRPRTWS